MSNVYRDDLGAALSCIDTLKPKSIMTIPKKSNFFCHMRELFISQPERWNNERIGWHSKDINGEYKWVDRDGWVIDSLNQYGQQSIGFYFTCFFWIRVGEVKRLDGGLQKANKSGWIYVFCPWFRRTIRKIKCQKLLEKLR